MPEKYSIDDLNRVMREFGAYNQQNVFSEDDAREFLFQRALESGDLDEDVIRELQNRWEQEPGDVFDEDTTPPEFDLSDARYNRDILDVSDYGGEIPYRGLEIDPDYEDYRVYNFLNENPKYRAFLEQQILQLPNRSAAEERVLSAIQSGEIDPQELNELRRIGYSQVLENTPESRGDFAFDVADEINRAALDNPNVPTFRNIYQNAAESLNVVDPIFNIPRELSRLETQQDYLDRAIQSAQRGQIIFGRFPGPQQQLELDVDPGDPRQALIQRAQQALAESREPVESVADIEQRRNSLYELQRNLNAVDTEGAARQVARSLVLPAVEARLTERDINNTLRNIENYERTQQMPLRDPGIQRAREVDQVLQAVNTPRSQMRGVTPEFSVDPTSPRQLIVPGLNEQIEEIASQARREELATPIENLRTTINQYPEVRELLNAGIEGSARPRLRGAEAQPYMKYVDTAQFITSPEDRADLYRKILSAKNATDDVALISRLNNIESAFTSGNPEEQRRAIESLQELGVGEDLNRIAEPASSRLLPIVGGGGYIRPDEAVLEFLDDRAAALRQDAQPIDPAILAEMYPGVSNKPQKIYKQEFTYDPKTQAVTPIAPGAKSDLPVYGIDMRVSEREGIYPSGGSMIPARVSANAFRFLQDNPVLNRANITFTTYSPGTGYGYEAKEIPGPVSKAFAQFAQENALKDLKPGTLVTNSPAESEGLYRERIRRGETPETSSTVRKLQPFVEEGYSLPNLRGAAYQSVGFGPTDRTGTQYSYIDRRGNAVPLQLQPAEEGLRGSVSVSPTGNVFVTQGRLPKTTKAYFSPAPEAMVGEVARLNPRGAIAGGALSLLNDEVAKAVSRNDILGAAGAFGKDIVTGALGEAAIREGGRQLAQRAPQVAAAVNPAVATAASYALPAVVGASLFSQGRTGSALDVLARKAAEANARVLPATRTDPKTDIGRRVGQALMNEGQYIFNRLRQNRVPYLPGRLF